MHLFFKDIIINIIVDTRVEDSGYIGCAPPGGEPIYKLLQVIGMLFLQYRPIEIVKQYL